MKKELLIHLGLNEKEIKIYTAVLKYGRITPAKLATLTKINRTTVYHICKGLVNKNFLLEDCGGSTMYVMPSRPTDLELMISKEKKELIHKEKMVGQIIDELKILSSEKEYPVPRIQFVEENRVEDHLYSNLERWNKSALAAGGIWWGFQDHTFVENYLKWIEKYWKNNKENVSVRLFSNQSNIETKLKGKYGDRQIRFLPNANFTTTIWIAGEHIIMIETKNHPYYLVEIHSKAMAENIRIVFERLWKT